MVLKNKSEKEIVLPWEGIVYKIPAGGTLHTSPHVKNAIKERWPNDVEEFIPPDDVDEQPNFEIADNPSADEGDDPTSPVKIKRGRPRKK